MADGMTPLTKRMAAVALSLRTRSFYWLLGGSFAVACTIFAALVHLAGNARAPVSSAPFPGSSGREATIGALKGEGDVGPEQAQSVAIYPASRRFQPKDYVPLPKAEHITLFSPFTRDDLRWVAAQPNLTVLTVSITTDQSIADLSLLATSSRLRALRVLGSFSIDTDEPIAWPPGLEVLDLQGVPSSTRRRLEELGRLPHLHTLAVRLQPAPSSSTLPGDVIATLQSFPALRHLYLAEVPDVFDALVRDTQRSLPGLSVRPSTHVRRVLLLPAICFAVGLWAAVLAIMLWPQFAAPCSVLMPGYRTPHLAVSGILFAAGLATAVGLLCVAGADWLAACGLCGGVLTLCVLLPALMFRRDPAMLRFTQPVMFTVLMLQACFWPVLMPQIGGGELAWFLRGERPWLSVLLIVTGALSVARVTQWLTRLSREMEEWGRGGLPLGLDPAGWKTPVKLFPHHQLRPWRTTRFERDMDAAASGTRGEAARRRRLWQAGAVVTSRGAIAIATAICGISFVYLSVVSYFTHDFRVFDTRLVAGGFACTILLMIGVPAFFTHARRQFYPMELLWPVSRADWVRDWFMMSADDLAIPSALTAAGVWAGWWFNIWPVLPPAHWLPLGVIFVGVALCIRATELWVRTHRQTPMTVARVLTSLTCGMATGGALAAWMLVGPPLALDMRLRSLPWLWTIALGILLTTGAVTYTAHRRWLRWEVAA